MPFKGAKIYHLLCRTYAHLKAVLLQNKSERKHYKTKKTSISWNSIEWHIQNTEEKHRCTQGEGREGGGEVKGPSGKFSKSLLIKNQ